MTRWVPLALVGLLITGCMSNNPGDGAPTTTGPTDDPCPDATTTSTVIGFAIYNGNWATVAPGSGQLICGEGDEGVNSLVSTTQGNNLEDFEAALYFSMVERAAPEGDAGAGMVLHFQDDANFQIVRYSPREQGWHLFTMTNGERIKQSSASVTPPTTNPEFNEWIHLRVVSQGGVVTAFDGETKVIEYTLPAGASTVGAVGYFLRAQQAAYFDALTATAL